MAKEEAKPEYPAKRTDWKFADAAFTDKDLTILGHPVMENWLQPYMADMAAVAASNGGTVLEFGFGMGISASLLQQHAIGNHIIIEGNAQVFNKLLNFSKDAKRLVVPIFGLWDEVVQFLASESIDGVLFDTYPLNEEELYNHQVYFVEIHRLLKPGGIFTYYSGQADDLTAHLEMLHKAGFKDISYRTCPVETPADCWYFHGRQIVTPIIRKGS